jgi:hypothetical protein
MKKVSDDFSWLPNPHESATQKSPSKPTQVVSPSQMILSKAIQLFSDNPINQ